MLELAGRLGPGSEIYGLDPSEDALEMLRAKIGLRGVANAYAVRGAGESMPFDNDYFDLVISNNGLNNVEDQEQVLKECRRVCRTGAQMVLTMNLPNTMIEFYDALREVLGRDEEHGSVKAMDAHIFSKRKPVEYLKELILRCGFNILSIQPEGFKYRFTCAQAFYDHYLIRNFFLPPWKDFLPRGKHEQILLKTAGILDREAADKGFIEISVPFVCFDCRK